MHFLSRGNVQPIKWRCRLPAVSLGFLLPPKQHNRSYCLPSRLILSVRSRCSHFVPTRQLLPQIGWRPHSLCARDLQLNVRLDIAVTMHALPRRHGLFGWSFQMLVRPLHNQPVQRQHLSLLHHCRQSRCHSVIHCLLVFRNIFPLQDAHDIQQAQDQAGSSGHPAHAEAPHLFQNCTRPSSVIAAPDCVG